MTIAKYGIYRGGFLALALIVVVVGAVVIFSTNASAQTPSDTESAVITCNADNPLGHGGTADNPPTCEDADGNAVEVVVVVTEQEQPAPVPRGDGWVVLAEGSDETCITAQAEAELEATAKSATANTILGEDSGTKSVSVDGEGCVRVEVRVSARGSASVQ